MTTAELFADLAKLATATKAARARTNDASIHTQAHAGFVTVGRIIKNGRHTEFSATSKPMSIDAATKYVEAMCC